MNAFMVSGEVQQRLDARLGWLRQHDIEFAQNVVEYACWCSALLGLGKKIDRPLNYLEIGSRNGGSLYAASNFLPANSTIISVDLPGGPWGRASSESNLKYVADKINSEECTCHLVLGDSKDPKIHRQVRSLLGSAPIDAMFIDADHTFAGVSRDWETYGPWLGNQSIAGFHDIAYRTDTPEVEVYKLWNALSASHSHSTVILQYGIGALLIDR